MNAIQKRMVLFTLILGILALTVSCVGSGQSGQSSKSGSETGGYPSASGDGGSEVSGHIDSGASHDSGGISTSSANSPSGSSSGTTDSPVVDASFWSKIGVENFSPAALSTKGLKAKTVYTVNMNSLLQHKTISGHDIWRMVASFQGVMNRDFAKSNIAVYLLFEDGCNDDLFWLDYMSKSGKFLSGYSRTNITSVEQFVLIFKNQLKEAGISLWDEKVPATSNLAATACGLYNYIPVRYDTSAGSLYSLFAKNGISVKENYVGKFTGKGKIPGTSINSTGSPKNDAYYWAAINYMSKTSPQYMAYYVDGAVTLKDGGLFTNDSKEGHLCSLPNHDFYIAKRAFFFDLSPVEDEAPCDEKNQPIGLDADTHNKLLQTQYSRNKGAVIAMGGHVPWQLKYSTHNNHGSQTNLEVEVTWNKLAGRYNIVADCDAAHPSWMTNASIYNHYPTPSSYPNHTKSNENITLTKDTIYLMLYVGDYDGSTWFKSRIKDLWSAPGRGTVPMMWSFDPNLVERCAPMFDFVYESTTSKDYFASGNSGAGQVAVSSLFKSLDPKRTLPDGGDAYATWSKKFFDKFNLKITGLAFADDAAWSDKSVLQMFRKFSPGGVFHHRTPLDLRVVNYQNTLFVYLDAHSCSSASKAVTASANDAVNTIRANVQKGYNYGVFRTVAYSYSQLMELQNAITQKTKEVYPNRPVVWVDPYTLFAGLKYNGVYSKTIS